MSADMSSVAEQLREARVARKLTVEQVAETTKVRADQVRALEAGDFRAFAAPVYLRGFVRTYSTLLKLDVAQVMAALEGEMGAAGVRSEPASHPERHRGLADFIMFHLSQIGWRNAVIGVGVVVVAGGGVGGYLLWRHHQKTDPLANLPPAVYHTTQSVSGETLPVPAPTPRK
jgi:cytoskeletal protein RodZ